MTYKPKGKDFVSHAHDPIPMRRFARTIYRMETRKGAKCYFFAFFLSAFITARFIVYFLNEKLIKKSPQLYLRNL